MTVSELAMQLNLETVSAGDPDREVTGGYAGDLLSWVMGRARPGDAWMTIMSNVNVAAVASLTDVACVILAEGVTPDDALRVKLASIDAAVLQSPLSAYELSHRIHALICA